jgi:hypothetical protein
MMEVDSDPEDISEQFNSYKSQANKLMKTGNSRSHKQSTSVIVRDVNEIIISDRTLTMKKQLITSGQKSLSGI